jgi:hypothetical protein
MDHAEERELEKDLKIRLVAPVYFCASKLEAYAGRGKNDFHASRDLEDLIAVVDGRAELVGEIQVAASDVRSYLAKEIKKLISIREFNDALPGHLPPDPARTESARLFHGSKRLPRCSPGRFDSEFAPAETVSVLNFHSLPFLTFPQT